VKGEVERIKPINCEIETDNTIRRTTALRQKRP
jgi:hypothetical protein